MTEPRITYMEDEHVYVWDDLDVSLTFERFREESGDIKADVSPWSASGDGMLPGEKVNISSARSIKMYANTLGGHGFLDADAWFACLTLACNRSKVRYREGEPSQSLAEVAWEDRPRFLVEPYLEMDSRAILFGDGGVSKSLHALALAASIATGHPVIPGTRVNGTGPVLYLDWEDEAGTHAERLNAICTGAGIEVPDNIFHMRRVGSLHDSVREIRKEIARRGVVFVVVDSVGAACGGDPEKAVDVIRAFDAMRALGVTTQAIHHVTKDQKDRTKPFGSVYAPNLVRLTWRLDREAGRNGEAYIRATNYKGNNVGAIEQKSHTLWFDADDNYRLRAVKFGASSGAALVPPARATDNSLRNRMGALFIEYGPLDLASVAQTLATTEGSARTVLNRHKDWFTKVADGRWDVLESVRAERNSAVGVTPVTGFVTPSAITVTQQGGPPIGAPLHRGVTTEEEGEVPRPPWEDEGERIDSLLGL